MESSAPAGEVDRGRSSVAGMLGIRIMSAAGPMSLFVHPGNQEISKQ